MADDLKLREGESKSERIRQLQKHGAQDRSLLEFMAGKQQKPAPAQRAADDTYTLDEAETEILDTVQYVFDHIEQPEPPPVEPPVEPPIEPPVEPPVTGKRYPVADDPDCGVPAGTSLSSSGGTTISQSGKVSGKKYTGAVVVTADDVEMFNCEIVTGAYFALDWKGKRGKLHHCTITNTTNSGSSGVNMRDLNAHHNRLRGHENCFNVAGNGGVIEWNDCDKMGGVQGQAHYDCIQADGGIDGLTIKHNRLNCDKGDTSGCMLDNYWGPIRNVTVEDNFIGGGSFPAYLDGKFSGASAATNIVYKNNDMRAGGWGGYFYWQSPGSGCQRTGNKDWKTGANVDNK